MFDQYFKSDVAKEIDIEKLSKAFSNFVLDFTYKMPNIIVYVSLVLPIHDKIYEIKLLNDMIIDQLSDHPRINLIKNNISSHDLLSDGIHVDRSGVISMINAWKKSLEHGTLNVIITH